MPDYFGMIMLVRFFLYNSPRKANQEKIEADERAENERIEQFARDKREREARFDFLHTRINMVVEDNKDSPPKKIPPPPFVLRWQSHVVMFVTFRKGGGDSVCDILNLNSSASLWFVKGRKLEQ